MPELQFRAATVSDIPALVELVTRSYRGEESRQGWTSEADLLDGERIVPAVLLQDIRRIDSLVLIAETAAGAGAQAGAGGVAGGVELIGCAHIERMSATTGYFGMFAVSPAAQGHGTGRQILAEAERLMASEWSLTESEMTVLDARTELLDFYVRRGYTRTGVFRPFPYGDERFGVPQRADLRLEVLTKPLGIRSAARDTVDAPSTATAATVAAPFNSTDFSAAAGRDLLEGGVSGPENNKTPSNSLRVVE